MVIPYGTTYRYGLLATFGNEDVARDLIKLFARFLARTTESRDIRVRTMDDY